MRRLTVFDLKPDGDRLLPDILGQAEITGYHSCPKQILSRAVLRRSVLGAQGEKAKMVEKPKGLKVEKIADAADVLMSG